jgi:ribonuclease P protein component
MKHETHVPAEQTEAQKDIRIPRPDENSRRTQSHPQTPSSRPQGSLRLKKEDRLLKRPEFLMLKGASRLVGAFICIDHRRTGRLRFGVTASSRYGNASERNRFKRLVREAFRTTRPRLPAGLALNILPRQKAKTAKMGDIREELLRLLQC